MFYFILSAFVAKFVPLINTLPVQYLAAEIANIV